MPINHINIDGNGRHASELRGFVESLRRIRADSRFIVDKLSAMNDGTDFTRIQNVYGFGSAADAKAAHDLLVAFNNAIDEAAPVENVLKRLG